MYNALIFGCGNIGARYDLSVDQVLTHAKAYSKDFDFSVDAYDPNFANLEDIQTRYGFAIIENQNDIKFSKYDIVSICSPTQTHIEMLELCFDNKVKVVICEKPISYDKEKIIKSLEFYSRSTTGVIVNYIRRFQPKFKQLKDIIFDIKHNDQLENINITYCRGFLNNCSHAFDLLEFLFETNLMLENIRIFEKKYDVFEEDPTVSLSANWGDSEVLIQGAVNVLSPVFQIKLIFKNHIVDIKNSGNDIEVSSFLSSEIRGKYFKNMEPLIFSNCLDNYMLPVLAEAKHHLESIIIEDNFTSSAMLNMKMIGYLNA